MMINLRTVCFSLSIFLVGWFALSCNSIGEDKIGIDQGLIGYWKLDDDILDHSENNHPGQAYSVDGEIDNVSFGVKDEQNSWLEIPSTPELQLGEDDFSIAVWVNALNPGSNISGDILSQYDVEQRKGIHLSIKTNPSPTGQSNFRQLSFGMDDNVSTDWEDCGRPGNALLAFGLTEYKGELYVSTWPSGRVFIYKGVDNWKDAGRLGEELEVMGLIVHNGQLLAGTLPLAEAYIYEGDTTWRRMEQLDKTENVKYRRAWTMAEHVGKVYCSTLPSGHVYAYEAGKSVTWGESFPAGWHHVVISKSADALKMYVDGKSVNTTPVPGSLNFDLETTVPFKIGFGQHDVFNGQIKEVRLYNRVLKEDEIGLLAKGE